MPPKPLHWWRESDSDGNTAEFVSLEELEEYLAEVEAEDDAAGDDDTRFPWSDNP